jgi:ribose 5-phosphate isomerase B
MSIKGISIILASDHAGLTLKDYLVKYLISENYDIVADVGTYSTDPVDYSDLAHKVAKSVEDGAYRLGVLVCGTGAGMAVTVNRYHGIRAVNCSDVYTAKMSRLHGDTNILTLGSRVVGIGLASEILNVWLSTPFSGDERHIRRIKKINEKPPSPHYVLIGDEFKKISD